MLALSVPGGFSVLPPSPPAGDPALQAELTSIIQEAGSPDSRWGVVAISLDRGDTILAMNPHERLIPASNMKVLTSAAAIQLLGPDFRYRSFLLSRGMISDGVLRGDLHLFGTGDPTLSERFHPTESTVLETMAQAVIQAGITRVEGDLVLDGSYFQGSYLHEDWDPSDFNDAFAAPVSALAVAENLVKLRVAAGPWVGAPAAVYLEPEGSGIGVQNAVRTAPPGTTTRVWLTRPDPSDPIAIEGEISSRSRELWRRLPVPDPLVYAGRQLQRVLEDTGVRVGGRLRVVRDPQESLVSPPRNPRSPGNGDFQILAQHRSPPLVDLLTVVNKRSNNFFAESVFKTLGRVVRGEGSFRSGAAVVAEYLREEVGTPAEAVVIRDGSGLSADNQVSPAAMVKILEHLAGSPEWGSFVGTLPEAGDRRELRRMYRTPAAGNLRAKTGTMDEVSALSGVVRTGSGERILFSVLSNGVRSERRAKRAEDRIGIALASLSRELPVAPSATPNRTGNLDR